MLSLRNGSGLRSVYSSALRYQRTALLVSASSPFSSFSSSLSSSSRSAPVSSKSNSLVADVRHALKTNNISKAVETTLASSDIQPLAHERLHVDLFRQAMKAPDSSAVLRSLYEKYMACGVRIGWMCAAVIIRDIADGNADLGLKTWVEFLESLGSIDATSHAANLEATWAALAAYVASCHTASRKIDPALALKLVPITKVPFPEELLQIHGYRQLDPALRNAIADGLRVLRMAKADPSNIEYLDSLPPDRPLELDQMYTDCREKAAAGKCTLSEAFYARVISCCAVSARTNAAYKVWNDMVQDNIQPTAVAYNALLKAAALNKHVAAREEMFSAVWSRLEGAAQPNAESYSLLIDFLFKQGKPAQARAVYSQIKAGEIPHVNVTLWIFNVTLNGLLENGLVQEAEELVASGVKSGLTPTVVSYNALIRTYIKRAEFSKASNTFDTMVATGIAPDVVTYTNIIDTVFKFSLKHGTDPTPEVDALLNEMLRSKIKVNAVTLTAIISGLAKSGASPSTARTIFDLMVKKNIRPNARTFGSLIDFELKHNNLDQAFKYFGLMSRFGVPRGTPMHNQLIHWAARHNHLDQAYDVFQQLCSSSRTHPNKFTYFFMLDGCLNSKNSAMATNVLQHLATQASTGTQFDMGSGLPFLIPRLAAIGAQVPSDLLASADAARAKIIAQQTKS